MLPATRSGPGPPVSCPRPRLVGADATSLGRCSSLVEDVVRSTPAVMESEPGEPRVVPAATPGPARSRGLSRTGFPGCDRTNATSRWWLHDVATRQRDGRSPARPPHHRDPPAASDDGGVGVNSRGRCGVPARMPRVGLDVEDHAIGNCPLLPTDRGARRRRHSLVCVPCGSASVSSVASRSTSTTAGAGRELEPTLGGVARQAARPRRATPAPPGAGRRRAVARFHAGERAAAAAQGGPLRAQGDGRAGQRRARRRRRRAVPGRRSSTSTSPTSNGSPPRRRFGRADGR